MRWLGAVQAQEFALACWSIGQRMTQPAQRAVDAAVADGSILRTHVLRPTWHFVARDDVRWMLALTSPHLLARMKPWDRRTGIDESLTSRSAAAIARAIERSGHLTRPGVAEALRAAGIDARGWVVGHLLMHAELRAVVCSGVPCGKAQTWALVDERAPKASAMTRDEALAQLTRRYFQSHGPATPIDFRWWSGLNAADARRGIEIAGASLTTVRSGDRTYFVDACDAGGRTRSAAGHLLQPFDELVVAYSESRGVMDTSGLSRTRGGDGLLRRCVIVDGQVAARWDRQLGRTGVSVVITPLRRFGASDRAAAERAAGRFGRFLHVPAGVSYRPR